MPKLNSSPIDKCAKTFKDLCGTIHICDYMGTIKVPWYAEKKLSSINHCYAI